MLILHAANLNDRLVLLGETPAESAVVPPKKRGRKPKIPRPAAYPFDPGERGLRDALRTIGLQALASNSEQTKFTLWLPSSGGKPAASSPLIEDTPNPVRKLEIAPWEITGLSLTISQTLDLLCTCTDKNPLAPGIIAGKDITFWTAAMRFAGSLTARQRYLPGLVRENSAFQARWETVIIEADLEQLVKLSNSMPQVCRAVSAESGQPPSIPAKEVLRQFMDRIADHLVRSAAVSSETQPTRKTRRKTVSPVFDSVHDQWLYALRSPEGKIEGDAGALTEFLQQVRAWRRPLHLAAKSPFRLCFRLEEPAVESDSRQTSRKGAELWRVIYLLQAVDDPSLQIPAEDVWNPRKRKTQSVFSGRKFNSQEFLLFTLGQASKICPRIESSLKSAKPSGYELNASGAMEFLNERTLQLEQAGFIVMLPAWWTRKGTKQRLSVRAMVKSPKLQSKGGLTLDTIVNYNWEIALGGEKLTLQDLQRLAKLKAPLVKFRGEWVQLNSAEIQAALDFWNKKTEEAVLKDVVQMYLGKGGAPGGLEFAGVAASGKVGKFLAELSNEASLTETPPSVEFSGTLRPYQLRGLSWLNFLSRYGLGACLADDMGLGKTIQALALIQRNWEAGVKLPTLLICPTSVMENWRREAAKFTPGLPVIIHHGIGRVKNDDFKKETAGQAIVISSYALLHRDFATFKSVKWTGIILDEAQNVKNPETKQSKAARNLSAQYRIAMTGTPVENHVGDLWSIMDFLNPGFLGGQTEFKREFFLPIQMQGDEEAVGRLKRLTGPFILRRLKTDKSIISDLPEKVEMKVFTHLTKEQVSLYEAVVSEMMESLKNNEGIQRKGLVLAAMSKLKQVCNHPAQFLGDNSTIPQRSGKLNRVTEMLEELLETDDRALIFTQFTEMGGILKRYLQETFGQEVLFLHGSVSRKQRDRMIDRFQSDNGAPRLFILSLKAGGTGLNLTKANHVFHFDRWWNPAVENQATDRAFRIGQTKNVMVHKLVCSGTLEERIDEMIENKKEIASQVVGTGEGWLTELSTAELKQIFTLRRAATKY